ncbi:MAG: hypothetical protein NTW74_14425, partial [Acidobacteria bacterium]|nr:hypothetical protein [Acidobacteriota bacterium]
TKADYKGVVRYLTSIEGEGVCLAWWNMQSSVDMGAAAWSVYSGRPMLQRVHLNRGAVAGSGCETVALVQDSFSMTPVTKQELEELSDLYPKQSVLRFRGASVYVLRPRLDKN